MKHACGPCFDLVRKKGDEMRCPDEPRVGYGVVNAPLRLPAF